MKVSTTQGIIRKARIHPAKGGVKTTSEAGMKGPLKGTLILATSKELNLLQALNQTDIAIRPDFMASDTYKALSDKEKGAFWKRVAHTVTINPSNNAHALEDKPIKIKDLLILYNTGPTRKI